MAVHEIVIIFCSVLNFFKTNGMQICFVVID